MKILIMVMGILGLFASCTGRKERLAKKEGSALNEFEVEKSKSYLDTDTLGNIVSFNKMEMILLKYVPKGLTLPHLNGIRRILLLIIMKVIKC